MRHIGIGACLAIVLCLLASQPVFAAIGAKATITSEQPIAGGKYEYTMSLQNTGDVPISTFWFGWVIYDYPPYYTYVYDLLPHPASNVQSPGGWFGSGAQDGIIGGYYSVEWYTGSPLQPGNSVSGFKFDTLDTPDIIKGPSYYGPPVLESMVYQNVYSTTSTSGASIEFTPDVAPAPEPALVGLLLPGMLLIRRKRI